MANLRSKLYVLLIAAMFSGSAFMVGAEPITSDDVIVGENIVDQHKEQGVQAAIPLGFRIRERP